MQLLDENLRVNSETALERQEYLLLMPKAKEK